MLGGPKKCARCDKQVYSIEELKCLDKIWHKNCFKCTVCSSLLNMKNYKGFDKLPYCVVHYPQQKHTAVNDNPELLRIKENTKIQSNAKYHEDFEKSKGNYTVVADEPEMRRVLENSKIISQVKYHEDFEKNIKNKYTPVLDNPETTRAIENQKIVSSAEYKGIKHNNNNGHGHQNGHNGHHFSMTSSTSNTNLANHHNLNQQNGHGSTNGHGLPMSTSVNGGLNGHSHNINGNHQQLNGTLNGKNTSSTSITNTLVASYKSGEKQMSDSLPNQRRIGSIADYDPLNYEGQLINNFSRQQISQQTNGFSTSTQSQQKQQQQQQQYHQSSTTTTNGYSSSNGGSNHYNNGYHENHIQQQQQQQQQLPINFANDIITSVYRAIYDYDAKEDDEISFRDGDKFINCERIDVGWMIGVHEKTGKHGMFPANYAEPIDLF